MYEHHLPWRVVVLCITSGSLDAVTVLAVGDAFASVMTGNFILLGVAAGAADLTRALACVAAIGGYVLGGLGGSWWVGRRKRDDEEALWPARVTETLGLEAVLLAIAAVAWAIVAAKVSPGLTNGLLALTAMAMGLQGAAVRAVGMPVSTTYMTGTLTGIAETLALRRAFSQQHRNGLYGLAAVLAGAVTGGLIVLFAAPAALFFPLAALCVVVVAATAFHRRHG